MLSKTFIEHVREIKIHYNLSLWWQLKLKEVKKWILVSFLQTAVIATASVAFVFIAGILGNRILLSGLLFLEGGGLIIVGVLIELGNTPSIRKLIGDKLRSKALRVPSYKKAVKLATRFIFNGFLLFTCAALITLYSV